MAAIGSRTRIYMQVLRLLTLYSCLIFVKCEVKLGGVSPADSSASLDNGILQITAETSTPLRLYGVGFSNDTRIAFTSSAGKAGGSCDGDRTNPVKFKLDGLTKYSGEIESTLLMLREGNFYYFCLQDGLGNSTDFVHQGSESDFLKVKTVAKQQKVLPAWLEIVLIVVLILLSGLFSGLNLGLMALDPTELKIVMNSGSPSEQKYARKIEPIRRRGNYLLCTLLLGNVLVNSSFTILLDGLIGNGIYAVIGSTAGIVIFGEIVPQSICSRHGLAVGARTVWITKFFMLATFLLSFPISRILDFVLGKEIGAVYNREQLLEMLKVQAEYNDLEGDEMNIISGVLKYKSKTVEEVMTSLGDCYMVDMDAVLDFKTITSIMQSGHSRIPVYNGERYNIVGLLFVKDLAFVDPDDGTPVKTVIKFYNHPVHRAFFDNHLDEMLAQFISGRSHLAIVQQVNDSGEGDPFYEALGVVTLEDILEEIIQAEIVDETDVYLDNKSGEVVPGRKKTMKDFHLFNTEQKKPKLSPQLSLAVFQYLATVVEPFGEKFVSKTVLKKLMEQDIVVELSKEDVNNTHMFLYKKGVTADYFVLILEGTVEVSIGQEGFTFVEGSFTCFGTKALASTSISTQNMRVSTQYQPDYTVCALSDLQYLKVTKALYWQAVQATQMERQRSSGFGSNVFGDDFDQHNPSVDEFLDNHKNVDRDSLYIETTC